MLRGAMYRAGGDADLRFGESSRPAAPAPTAEQRRRAARVDVALLASITPLADDGTPAGGERQFLTRDMSLGGLGLSTGNVSLPSSALVRFTVTLPDLSQLGGTARVVRAVNGMCGLRFEDVAPADRVKLAGFLVSQKRPRGAAAAAPA
jgi:c-di-GMP-binding flagellar brake protein YcgR